MLFRMIGFIVTFAIIALLFVMTQRQGQQAVDGNAAVQEQKKILQEATGVDPNDKKALQDQVLKQAKELEEYQNQLNQPSPQE